MCAGHIAISDARFAAEQFLQMVVSVPQRRALGLGVPLTPAELEEWTTHAVDFFLHGCRVKGEADRKASIFNY